MLQSYLALKYLENGLVRMNFSTLRQSLIVVTPFKCIDVNFLGNSQAGVRCSNIEEFSKVWVCLYSGVTPLGVAWLGTRGPGQLGSPKQG
jgi:hypothetical protein